MHRLTLAVALVVVAALFAGCTGSDDDADFETGSGADSTGDPTTGDPDATPLPGDDDPPVLPEPMINLDTHEAMLEEVFRIYSGAAWDSAPLWLSGFGVLFESPETAITLEDGRHAAVGPARCQSGSGRLELELPDAVANFPWRGYLDACAPDPDATGLELISGNVDGVWNWHTSAHSDDLVWTTAAGEKVSFSGEIRVQPEESMFDTLESFIATNANQSVRDGSDDALLFSIVEATSEKRFGAVHLIEDIALLSGSFTYRSALTGGRAVTVRTPLELSYHWDARTPAPDGVAPEELGDLPLGDVSAGGERTDEQWAAVEVARTRWAFTTGMLELQAEDGSRVLLDADTGNLRTVRITLDTGRGSGAEENIAEWPVQWYQALDFDTRQMTLSDEAR